MIPAFEMKYDQFERKLFFNPNKSCERMNFPFDFPTRKKRVYRQRVIAGKKQNGGEVKKIFILPFFPRNFRFSYGKLMKNDFADRQNDRKCIFHQKNLFEIPECRSR